MSSEGSSKPTLFVSRLLQPDATGSCSTAGYSTALGAIATDFEAADHNVKLAIALDLTFQAVEQIAFELRDFAATQASHVNMVALGAALIIVLFALHVHEIEFIDEAVTLEQAECSIDGDAIDMGIDFTGAAEQLTGIEMLLGGLHYAQDGAALAGHAQATGHKFTLQAAGDFGLGKGHKASVESELQV
jgi:hypothetical protein